MARPAIEDILSLSPLQQGMLFHSVLEPDARLYYEQVCFVIPGVINIEVFRRAWNELTRRHQVLRAAFFWEKIEKPVQLIHRNAELAVHTEDWSRIPVADQIARLQLYLETDRARGLDLAVPPLMRVALFRLSPAAYQFVASFHHAILDGWSVNLLFRELLQVYEAFLRGGQPDLPPPRPYSRFISWLGQQDPTAAEAFWRAYLAGYNGPPRLSLGTEKTAHAGAQGFGERHVRLSTELSEALQQVARQEKVTLNVVVQTAWAILLSRYSGGDDIVFGAVVSGRPPDLEGIEGMIGLFINTQPVRANVASDQPLRAVFADLHRHQREARQFEYCSLVQIQGWSDVPRGTPLFESLFIFENLPGAGAKGNQPNSSYALERTNYPLTLLVAPGSAVDIKALFIAPQVDGRAAVILLGQLNRLLQAIVDNPAGRIGDLPWVPDHERRQLLDHAAGPKVESLPAARLETLFHARLRNAPDEIALIDGEKRWTVSELGARAAALEELLASRGVGSGDVVGIFLPPCAEIVAAMLATLCQGAAFLLLDPAYPDERIAFMVRDSGAAVVLTSADHAARLPPGTPALTQMPTQAAGAAERLSHATDDLAYVVYTSGSTGQPKGVMQTHRATLNRFAWMWRAFPFEPHDTCCQKTALGFVDVVWEVLGPVLGGAPLVFVPEESRRDPLAMIRFLAQKEVTRIVLVPSLLRAMLAYEEAVAASLFKVRFWICSGEALPADLARRFHDVLPEAVLLNLYGSSEVAADVTCEIVKPEHDKDLASIGYPLDGTAVHVLDAQIEPVPAGIPGEIWVGGAQLAHGYLRQPGLTALRFVPDPFTPGARLYRTGDVGRRSVDGRLEYLSRADHQIKVNGFRIEPAEIEAAIAALPGIHQAVVTAVAGDDGAAAILVAFVTAEGAAVVDVSFVRDHLRAHLPDFMVPGRIVTVPALPLLPNGKTDRNALPALIPFAKIETAEDEPPATETEKELSAIWSALLRVRQPGRNANFFELGGHSLLVMQLASRVAKKWSIELPLRVVFDTRTLGDLALRVEALRTGTAAGASPEIKRLSREDHRISLTT